MGIIVMMNRILSLWLVAAGSQERLVAMKTLLTQWSLLLCGLLASSCLAAADIPEPNRQAPAESGISRATNRPLPWIFLVGDSTVHNSGKILGWGDVIGRYFNFDRIRVENCAKAGRSSRTFQTQGWWRQILDAARPGDFVFIQMGHNDAGPLDDTNRARGTIRGVDEETREIYNPVLQRAGNCSHLRVVSAQIRRGRSRQRHDADCLLTGSASAGAAGPAGRRRKE